MTQHRISLLALAVFVACPLMTAADPIIPTLKSVGAQEVIDPIVPISGNGIVGAVMTGPGDHIDPDALYVRFRAPASGSDVDIYLNSPDSRYSASWKIQVPKGFTGWARIEYPGSAQDRLRKYELHELAALASDGTAVFPVRWTRPEDTDSLLVMINSERATAYSIRRDKSGAKKVQCTAIQSRQTLRYDKQCLVDLEHAARSDDRIEIRRRRGGTVLSPLRLRIDG